MLVESAAIVLTLVVLEAVLSFDNAAILTVLSRRVPDARDRKRALNYGLLIAYGLRVVAIVSAVFLIKYPLFLALGGLYLLVLALKHFYGLVVKKQKDDAHPDPAQAGASQKSWGRRLGITPFTAVIVQIGVVDLVFALDQVVAAVAFVQTHPYRTALILVAATIGLVSLRLLAPFIARLMDWLPILEHMAYVAVGFVGVIMLGEHLSFDPSFKMVADPEAPGAQHVLFHVPSPIKIAITLGLFAVPILMKLLLGKRKGASS